MGFNTYPFSPFPPSTVDMEKGDVTEQQKALIETIPGKAQKADIAPEFSTETVYNAGDLVYYNGALYEFTADHAAGAWSTDDTQEATIDGSLDQLKSGLTNLDNEVNGDAVEYPYADVITIPDAVPSNLADCTVKIEPDQDLHGYDKPWVGGAGKNKIDYKNSIKDTTSQGLTFKENTNGYISVSGRNTGGRWGIIELSGLANGSYKIIVTSTDNQLGFRIYNGDTGVAELVPNVATDFVMDSTKTSFTIDMYIDTTGNDIDGVFTVMIVESTETDLSFAPYTNICPISGHTEASVEVTDGDETTKTYTIALGDTIYGGTVDFDSGVMTVDREYYSISSTSDFRNNQGSFPSSAYVIDVDPVGLSNGDIISNKYVNGVNTFINSSGKIRINTYDSYESKDAAFSGELSGAQFVYELATPTTIQLTPKQIQLLKGTNTLTASTGQISVTANGVSGSIGQVQEQVNETDAALAELAANIAEQLPDAPTTDGAYVLTVTVADGTPTYSWESAI